MSNTSDSVIQKLSELVNDVMDQREKGGSTKIRSEYITALHKGFRIFCRDNCEKIPKPIIFEDGHILMYHAETKLGATIAYLVTESFSITKQKPQIQERFVYIPTFIDPNIDIHDHKEFEREISPTNNRSRIIKAIQTITLDSLSKYPHLEREINMGVKVSNRDIRLALSAMSELLDGKECTYNNGDWSVQKLEGLITSPVSLSDQLAKKDIIQRQQCQQGIEILQQLGQNYFKKFVQQIANAVFQYQQDVISGQYYNDGPKKNQPIIPELTLLSSLTMEDSNDLIIIKIDGETLYNPLFSTSMPTTGIEEYLDNDTKEGLLYSRTSYMYKPTGQQIQEILRESSGICVTDYQTMEHMLCGLTEKQQKELMPERSIFFGDSMSYLVGERTVNLAQRWYDINIELPKIDKSIKSDPHSWY